MKTHYLLFLLLAGFSLVANPQTISFTHLPAWGSSENLEGRVTGVNYKEHKVQVFLYYEGSWWVKPYSMWPNTTINPDNSFTCDVTTGGADIYAARYLAFLLPKNAENNFNLPDLMQFPHVLFCRVPGNRKINFSGIDWTIKSAGNNRVGPNSNIFSDSDENVYKDISGKLHLKINHNKASDAYQCAEVIADTSFGYGTYRFIIYSGLDSLDKNVVFSPFVWDEYADNEHYREIDFFEASRWGNSNDPNFQYVIQPWNVTDNRHRFEIGSEKITIHEALWTKDSIVFRTMNGDKGILHSWVYKGNIPKPGKENIRINLWLNSVDQKPSNPGKTIEVVISEVSFSNLIQPPQKMKATRGELNEEVLITWEKSSTPLWYRIYRSETDDPLTAVPITGWAMNISEFNDKTAGAGMHFYYFLRCADNALGSNSSGLASGYSYSSEGWGRGQTTGLQPDRKSGFIFYPNPSTGIIRIKSASPQADGSEYRILVHDNQGRKIHQMAVDGSPETEFMLQQPSGIYHLAIEKNGEILEQSTVILSR